MAANFPNSPNNGDTFTSNGTTFTWDGTTWKRPTTGGVKGETGQKGEKGEKGTKGEKGEKGDKGEKGEKGQKGQKGEVGDKGQKGEGDKGEKGADNSTKGQKGEDNSTKGQKGEIGQKGQKGQDNSTKGQKGATGADNSTKGQKGEVGEKGTVGSTTKGQKGDTGADNSTKGQKGEQGIEGAAADKGQKGEIGAQGTGGTQGVKGEPGSGGSDGVDGDKGQKGEVGTAGTDASLVVDGISLTRASNTITDLFDGYTVNLVSTTSSSANLTSTVDNASATTNLQKFVDSVNTLKKLLGDKTFRGDPSLDKGELADDTAIKSLKKQLSSVPPMEGLELSSFVSTDKTYTLGSEASSYRVAVLDFGVKKSILSCLESRGVFIKVFPLKTPLDDILNFEPNGIFLSNGPGDPFATGDKIINTLRKLIDSEIPIFGICLGHQILSLALGAKTKKMNLLYF